MELMTGFGGRMINKVIVVTFVELVLTPVTRRLYRPIWRVVGHAYVQDGVA